MYGMLFVMYVMLGVVYVATANNQWVAEAAAATKQRCRPDDDTNSVQRAPTLSGCFEDQEGTSASTRSHRSSGGTSKPALCALSAADLQQCMLQQKGMC